MASENQEDYLKSIFMLSAKKNRAIKTKELASELSVSSASITEMIAKLAKAGLVEVELYYGFSLTRKGIIEALKILRKHRLLEKFLADTIGLPKSSVHSEAHRLEHVVSDETLDRIDHMLKSPCYCPHHSRIPGKKERVVSLSDLQVGETARIVFSKLKDVKAIDQLNSMGLLPETEITMVRRIRNGPLMLRVRGSEIALDTEFASQFYVEQEKKACNLRA